MKAFYVLPLLLLMTSCKYNSLDKIIKGADAEVLIEGNRENMGCLNRQLNRLNIEISRLEKSSRSKIVELMKDKVDRVILREDEHTQTINGVHASLSQVTTVCQNQNCWFEENATKPLKDDRTYEGSAPEASIILEGRDLIIQSGFARDLSVHKKYYTKSVNSYDINDDLEAALRDSAVWNFPTEVKDSKKCAKETSLQNLIQVIQ